MPRSWTAQAGSGSVGAVWDVRAGDGAGGFTWNEASAMTRTYQSSEHPYSESRLTRSGLLFVSGVLPYRDDGTIERDPLAAVQCVVRQLANRLHDAGCGLQDVVDVLVFVTDVELRSTVNQVFSDVFTSPMPCRSVIGVKELPQGAVVEIRAVAEP